jgi:hypothetical protein
MTDKQILEFHMLNFFKVKADYASTMEMNHDLKKSGLPEAGGNFVELLYNPKLVDQKILPNKWSEYKINEYGQARWDRLYAEMQNQERLLAALPMNQPTSPPTAPQQNIIKEIWLWVMTNPMIATIIGGTIALVIGTIILKKMNVIS